MLTRATMPMERVSPPPPSAAGRGGRTQFRGDVRSPPFSAAATSAPLSRSVLPAQPLAKSPHGTLLEPSGREQRLRELAERASNPHPRAVPAGRDWRNPSRPPPPMAAFDAEPARAPVDTSAPTIASPRQLRAPPLDTPRYVDRLLELCHELGASDLQLHAGAAPYARVDGKLWPLAPDQRLTRAQAESAIGELLDDAQQLQIHVDGQLRFVYELAGGLRARAQAFLSEQGMHLALRLLPREVPPAERLGLGPALRVLRDTPHGLCVCSSPAGAGRTTSLFALTAGLIADRALHVVSIEDPIELEHRSGLGLVEQRELGQHVASIAEGVEWALRQSVDVIVISDVLAPGALAACLHACRARCLVLAGMRASNLGSALGRLIHGSPNPELTRIELAHGLRLLVQQRLVPKARVPGRVAAIEQVVNTPQIAQLIRDDKLQQLPAVMSASKSTGMASLDDALEELVRVGTITPEVAQRAARRSERFKAAASGS
jgi:twitching motility protein PilT